MLPENVTWLEQSIVLFGAPVGLVQIGFLHLLPQERAGLEVDMVLVGDGNGSPIAGVATLTRGTQASFKDPEIPDLDPIPRSQTIGQVGEEGPNGVLDVP